MKNKISIRIIAMLVMVTMLLCSFVACTKKEEEPQHVEYVDELKLDMATDSLKQEVTVKNLIDGDTTHFNVPASVHPTGETVLKARYLAINTPESTGRVEPWGKAASNFTKEKLSSATSIIIESDDGNWNADSTGNRYMVWVWYKTDEMTEYRNLNLEILQNGLAIASNSAQNRYGALCMKAIEQAKAEKLYVYSTDKDPNFHYGAAQELTLKELRTNISTYDSKKVAFEGVISAVHSGSFYIEEYDEETAINYGISVYYATAGLPGMALEQIVVGNRVRVVGTVSPWNDTWQVSGITYSMMNPDDPNTFKVISKGHTPAFTLTELADFHSKKLTMVVNVEENEEIVEKEKTFSYAELVIDTSISFEGLDVIATKINDKGEVTLTCQQGDNKIKVFLGALKDADGNPITEQTYENETINVKGLVDKYYENYQVRVTSASDITVVK